jgi:cytochrome c553
VLVLTALTAIAVWTISDVMLNQRVVVPQQASIPIPTDLASIRHGQHLASAIALCVQCHEPNMAGRVLEDDSSARISAPDITRGGRRMSDAERIRAIRQGVDPAGRKLLLMPSNYYNQLSDGDVAAIVAYLSSLPPLTNVLPPDEIRPLGRLRFLAGRLDLLPSASIDRAAARPKAPDPAASPAYGQYLAGVAGCARCHGPAMSGGTVPNTGVKAPDITSTGLEHWSETDFLNAIRTGKRPDGSQLDAAMPWQYYAQMSELELQALWQFLSALA